MPSRYAKRPGRGVAHGLLGKFALMPRDRNVGNARTAPVTLEEMIQRQPRRLAPQTETIREQLVFLLPGDAVG